MDYSANPPTHPKYQFNFLCGNVNVDATSNCIPKISRFDYTECALVSSLYQAGIATGFVKQPQYIVT